MKIYGDSNSGNCLKVKYTADYLGLGYEWVPVDITQGESRTPDFLSIIPQGQVPVIQLEDGRSLAQSKAIIRYVPIIDYYILCSGRNQQRINQA